MHCWHVPLSSAVCVVTWLGTRDAVGILEPTARDSTRCLPFMFGRVLGLRQLEAERESHAHLKTAEEVERRTVDFLFHHSVLDHS